jgi:hypothetical protein
MTIKATPLAAFAIFALAALCAFAPGAASAQPRGNVYAVSGVYVDETAANAAAAQQAGLAAAQRIGFQRLVRRITVPSELAAQGGAPAVEGAALERLVSSVDVQEERRSATRYIGRLTVRFDPDGVRNLLRARGLTVLDTRTAPTLVAAVAVDTPPETAALWREVWTNGGFGDELAPLAAAPEALQGAPAWDAAAPFAQAAAASAVLYATLRVQGSTASATLVQVSANARTERGQVTARINGSDTAALRAALSSLAEQASDRVQADWKSSLTAGNTGQRGRISASALYANQAQWERIKQGLEGAAQTLISEIRIEAVGREGALVSFSFVGDRNQLVNELQRRGVRLEDSASGPVLRVAAGR